MSQASIIDRATAKFIRLQARVTRKFVTPFGRDLDPDRWIFVIGCFNSGTSLLADILGSHSEIGGLPNEGQYFADHFPYAAQFGWPRMWVRCLDKVQIKPDDLDEAAIRRIKRQWSIYYPRHTPNLVEKSIAHATRMEFLQAHFQPAYFIVITRNGYAVAEGIQRRVVPGQWGNWEYPDQYPIGLCAEQWRASDELVRRQRPTLDHVVEITYEELTDNTAATLQHVTDFLGIDPFPDSRFSNRWTIRDKEEPIRNMNSRSFQRLSREDLDEIEAVAGDRLKQHGYRRPQASQPDSQNRDSSTEE